jgi:acyl-CoA synthetase (AMP-forming)/AMP-acid ligase II
MIRLPLNPRANKPEWVHIINSFEPKVLVFEETFAPLVAEFRSELKPCPHFIFIGQRPFPDGICYEDLATGFSKAEPDIDTKESDPYIIQSTSGSMGFPKAALISQEGTIRRTLIRAVDLGNDSNGVYLAVTSLANTASTFYGLSQLYLGGRVILRNRFDPGEFLETIEREKVTNVSLVPVMGERILEEPNAGEYDLSSLKILLSYGAPLHSHTKEKLIKHVSPNLVETYGISETGPVTNLMPRDQMRKTGSVGQPTMHTKIKIVDTNGNTLPVGEEGEIVVKTPYLFMGYLNNPEETAKVLKDGWFHTGDIGKLDEQGYLYILGRSKNIIISGGYNIYEEEVEGVLARHPKVKEVAVIGVPDEKWGEAVKAIVVLRPDVQASEKEIIDFCKENMASYKKPQSVDFVTGLLRLSSGKVAKQKLREKYWEGSNFQSC